MLPSGSLWVEGGNPGREAREVEDDPHGHLAVAVDLIDRLVAVLP